MRLIGGSIDNGGQRRANGRLLPDQSFPTEFNGKCNSLQVLASFKATFPIGRIDSGTIVWHRYWFCLILTESYEPLVICCQGLCRLGSEKHVCTAWFCVAACTHSTLWHIGIIARYCAALWAEWRWPLSLLGPSTVTLACMSAQDLKHHVQTGISGTSRAVWPHSVEIELGTLRWTLFTSVQRLGRECTLGNPRLYLIPSTRVTYSDT